MSSHSVAIAKASLAASLLRPDPQALSRDNVAHFHTLLHEACVRCSPANVQNCKRWIISNITSSSGRCTALGKYLVALSSSIGTIPIEAKSKVVSCSRQRLHLLYVLNDVLCHAQQAEGDLSVAGKIQPVLVALFSHAASFVDRPKHQRKLQQLLDFWNERKIYSKDYIGKLREVVISGARGEVIGEDSTSALGRHDGSRSKTMPFVMPAMHGDPSTPWFDLPAGNMMPHIMPNSTRAINPVEIKPLRFVTGPADENLAFAVKTFLNEVDTIFGIVDPEAEIDESILDFDEVGQAIVRDEITKEVLEGEGYYGWSRQFCEKMRRRKLRNDPNFAAHSRSRDSSRSRSRSSSEDVARRRRYKSSANGSRSRSRSSHRNMGRHSRDRSRSPSSERHQSRSRSPHLPSRSFGPYDEGRTDDRDMTGSSLSTEKYLGGNREVSATTNMAIQPSFTAGLGSKITPIPPPPEAWPHPFPPPPPPSMARGYVPPPPPFMPPQQGWQQGLPQTGWQQGLYSQAFPPPPPPPPPPPGEPTSWQSLHHANDGMQGDRRGYNNQGPNDQGYNRRAQYPGRGRGTMRGHGW